MTPWLRASVPLSLVLLGWTSPSIAGVLAAAGVRGGIPVRADDRIDKLAPDHKRWIERDVVYIISEREREVFLSLETLEERNRFIESFWRKRDPNPATPENEFKIEHEKRLEHADKFLGRETFRAGWQTDRGRYHIILGEPRDIQRYSGYSKLVSSELWFYQGDTSKGVPSFFYLLFFKRNDFGEFKLYSPIVDGPHSLLNGDFLPGGDSTGAVQAIREVSVELATASLSFDTSDPPDFLGGRPSLGTNLLISRIESSPLRAIRTDYADAWGRYGNMVSSEYSFNFVPSRSNFAMILGPEDTALIQYNIEIEPQNFSLETDEDRESFYTTLDISVDVRGAEDKTILALNKEVFVKISPSQMAQVQASPFAYQDSFPLVAGEYDVTVILRNRVLKQYTVAEAHLTVDDYTAETPKLTPPILGYDVRPAAASDVGAVKTYQVGGEKVLPAAQGLFVLGENIHVVTQIHGAPPQDYAVEFSIEDESGKSLQARTVPVGDATSSVLVEPFQLRDMVGGNYVTRAKLKNGTGETVSEQSTPFILSPRSGVPRAQFIYRRGFNVGVPGLLSLAKGDQLWNAERYDEAEAELEKAVAAGNPRLPQARWKLAEAFLRQERFDDVLHLLTPLEQAFSSQYEVVAGLGFGYYFKRELARAAEYLERAKAIRPPETNLLNALADCYQALGQDEKARENYQRSLALNPEQGGVKDRLAALTDKVSPK